MNDSTRHALAMSATLDPVFDLIFGATKRRSEPYPTIELDHYYVTTNKTGDPQDDTEEAIPVEIVERVLEDYIGDHDAEIQELCEDAWARAIARDRSDW